MPFVDAGEGRVIVPTRIKAVSLGGGVPVELEASGLYTVEDGVVCRIELFASIGEAYAAAGLPEPDGR
jgi:hypothetical protein